MFGIDKLFDFNGDGHLNVFERAAQLHFMDEMMRAEESDSLEEEEEIDVFAEAGLDYDELELMDPQERREVLEEAGLDPDAFDF